MKKQYIKKYIEIPVWTSNILPDAWKRTSKQAFYTQSERKVATGKPSRESRNRKIL
jgi:hypothetical protein